MVEKCPACHQPLPLLLAAGPPTVSPVLPRPPFDWSPYIRYAIQGVIMLLAGIGAYYAPAAKEKADVAAKHAETAAVQSEKNGDQLKAHGEKLKRLAKQPE